jgi:2-amino-4-hydroxy-6-hydroxymethyldihydropteridine diphosphokinase
MNDVADAVSEQIAFVALGSNLGDRFGHLRFAVDALTQDPEITVLAVSPVYDSPAHSIGTSEVQPHFLNSVVKLSTSLNPNALLQRLQRIEHAAGRRRERGAQWAPRTLDLDLLIFGEEVIDREELTVPHPRLGGRRFVLRPLADLDPDRHVPDPYNRTVAELLADCPDPDRPLQTPFSL